MSPLWPTQKPSDPETVLKYMRETRAVAQASPHPVNKVAATVFGRDHSGHIWQSQHTNYWPRLIEEKLGRDRTIGSASGTVHSETAAILSSSHATDGASMCVTDPCCPNCAKNIVEAGIRHVYLDSDGFEKDFYKRRARAFDMLTLDVFRRAGVLVSQVDIHTGLIKPLIDRHDLNQEKKPAQIIIQSLRGWKHTPSLTEIFKDKPSRIPQGIYAKTILLNPDRQTPFLVTAYRDHPDTAYGSMPQHTGNQYSPDIEPIDILLMWKARMGYRFGGASIMTSHVPTCRELVHVVGSGIQNLVISNMSHSIDPKGSEAVLLLTSSRILNISRSQLVTYPKAGAADPQSHP
jgi:dCMP deaminase